MEDDVEVGSMIVVDGSIIKYKDRVAGFSQTEGVALDVTLALGFSWDEEVNLV
jgi:hypothetical protein